MNNLEKLLNESKNELNKLDIPEEMESKLKNSLNNVSSKKRRYYSKWKYVAVIIIVLMIGYNVDALAYYGKQLVGYENIMNGTLKELNELNKGQIIDKSYVFDDQVEVILDGAMLDDNNLVVFYRIKDLLGNIENENMNLIIQIQDRFGKIYNSSGSGLINDDKTEINWVMNCEKPDFFKKYLVLKIYSSNYDELGKINFKLDRNKAMGHTLKIKINEDTEIENKNIRIESLMASPISTVIKGNIQNLKDLVLEETKGERFVFNKIELALIAKGKEIPMKGSNISGDKKGSKFNLSFGAIPKDTKEIEIRLISFGVNYDIKETIKIDKDNIDKEIKILNQDVVINRVYESQGNTYIKITTDENLVLSSIFLSIDGERVEVEKIHSGRDEKVIDYDERAIENKVETKHNRTIEFKGIGEELELDIQQIRYNKLYDDTIYKHSIK